MLTLCYYGGQGSGWMRRAVINTSEENVDRHGLVSGICRAEIQSQVVMKRMTAAGRTGMEVAESSGWIGNGFIGDLLHQNQRVLPLNTIHHTVCALDRFIQALCLYLLFWLRPRAKQGTDPFLSPW